MKRVNFPNMSQVTDEFPGAYRIVKVKKESYVVFESRDDYNAWYISEFGDEYVAVRYCTKEDDNFHHIDIPDGYNHVKYPLMILVTLNEDEDKTGILLKQNGDYYMYSRKQTLKLRKNKVESAIADYGKYCEHCFDTEGTAGSYESWTTQPGLFEIKRRRGDYDLK